MAPRGIQSKPKKPPAKAEKILDFQDHDLDVAIQSLIDIALAYRKTSDPIPDSKQYDIMLHFVKLANKIAALHERNQSKLDPAIDFFNNMASCYQKFRDDKKYNEKEISADFNHYYFVTFGRNLKKKELALLIPQHDMYDVEHSPKDVAAICVGRFYGISPRTLFNYQGVRRSKFLTFFNEHSNFSEKFEYTMRLLGFDPREAKIALDAIMEYRRIGEEPIPDDETEF